MKAKQIPGFSEPCFECEMCESRAFLDGNSFNLRSMLGKMEPDILLRGLVFVLFVFYIFFSSSDLVFFEFLVLYMNC